MKISVILPSFLQEYEGSSKEREKKFIRAINSFLDQTYCNKELIVVSDGCKKTCEILEKEFPKHSLIKICSVNKQPLFSGSVRQFGIDCSSGETICYLDSDDTLLPIYLETIVNNIGTSDWAYFNHIWAWPDRMYQEINTELKHGHIGTSSIAHKKSLNASWLGCDGYGHDWQFISKLISASSNYKKIQNPGYLVRHIPGKFDN